MNKIFITGATGFIGYALTQKLVEQGHIIHALVRNPSKSPALVHPNIILFKGDLNNEASITTAIKGCSQVYHVAGDVRIWAKNPKEIFETNIVGATNVFNAALQEGVEKIVFTSTCGVTGPSLTKPMTEEDPRIVGFDVEYELSKKIAEDNALKFFEKGLNIVIVRPSKVYGPGQTKSRFSAMQLIADFIKKKFVLIPAPGNFIANFSFINDVVDGHIKAMEFGRSGEKYILGGQNISHQQFFACINNFMNNRCRIIKIPKAAVKLWAYIQLLKYRLLGQAPLFTPKSVSRAFAHHQYSSDKAIKELHYHITPLNDAVKQTLHYLNTYHHE